MQGSSAEALYLSERIVKIARILLAQNPMFGERTTYDSPELAAIIEAGNGAVKYLNEDGSVDYIVVKDGTRETTRIPPAGYDLDRLPAVPVELSEPVLLPELQAAATRLEQLDPELYRSIGVRDTLNAVSAYQQHSIPVDILENLMLQEAISPGLAVNSDLAVKDDEARDWARTTLTRLTEAYLELRLSGNALLRAAAVCMLLASSPTPGKLYGLGVAGMVPGDPSEGFGPDARFLPVFEVALYLAFLEHYGADGVSFGFEVAKRAHQLGDDWQRQARDALAFFDFHAKLYLALLYYRAALHILSALMGHPKLSDTRGVQRRRGELRDRRDFCEEMRVTILAPLASAAHPRATAPDLSSVTWWDAWLSGLARMSLSDAKNDILDRSIRLVFPDFYRELALLCTQLDRPEARQPALTSALRFTKRWRLTPTDEQSPRPAHVIGLYARIVGALHERGDIVEATEWQRLLPASQQPEPQQ